jgi:N6-adenosine-specific RNA methylase IME4
MTLPFHPLADIFPLIEGAEFDELVEDIKAQRLQEPIDIYQGKILDGRNRYRAGLAAGLEFDRQHVRHFRPELYGDPLAYVISKNLKRRHLNESQRAYVAAKLANLPRGRPPIEGEKPANLPLLKQGEAAQKLNISERSVRSAAVVRDSGIAELQHAVEQGRLAISAAAQAARLPADMQRKIAREAEAGHANVVRSVIKKETRVVREANLGAKQRALPDSKFGVIVADSEWKHKAWSEETGEDRAANQHYPTQETDIIASRPVAAIAAPDSALFLWGTASMLPDALRVMAAWGFTYKTHFIWAKDRAGNARGMGRWLSDEHELLLLGTRGSVPAPTGDLQHRSVFHAPVGEHSEKPDVFLEMIERYFPTLPKIELNRRGPARPGWDAWGLEAESSVSINDPRYHGNDLPHGNEVGKCVARPINTEIINSSDLKQTRAPVNDDNLDIPSFLLRGHPDCPIGRAT